MATPRQPTETEARRTPREAPSLLPPQLAVTPDGVVRPPIEVHALPIKSTQDFPKVLQWYYLVAGQGNPMAQVNLGLALLVRLIGEFQCFSA